MSQLRHLSKLLPVLVVLAVIGIVGWAARSPLEVGPVREAGVDLPDLKVAVARLDRELGRRWKAESVTPTPPAPDLQVLRRLSLALHGTNPSLEEIRQFEDDRRPDRLEHFTRRLLADVRFADYFAERLARGFVGTEGGQFVTYRRERFVDWLAERMQKNTPYDVLVREMIATEGLWTGQPATNFITAAVNNGAVDANKLAGKSVRAFLGQRIDCAQCHDHPFEHWKQSEFEGLAAFFGQVQQTVLGIEDKAVRKGKPVVYEVEDRMTLKQRAVAEAVPFNPECLPETGSRRERFAAWITDPANRRFERAIANRIWGLMFGRPYLEPVDDLPDPRPLDSSSGEERDVLDWLGQDFREHGYNLHRLIQVIAASQPFRIDSQYPAASEGAKYDAAELDRAEMHWAMFPLIRLRPEQVIGSILQCSSTQTVDQNSHPLLRLVRFTQGRDFVREYGDLGESELQERGGTILQRLLLMNGNLAAQSMSPQIVNAAGRIRGMAGTDEKRVEAAFLVCLTRRPTPAEQTHFVNRLSAHAGNQRGAAVEDLYWSLLNSMEFSWNH